MRDGEIGRVVVVEAARATGEANRPPAAPSARASAFRRRVENLLHRFPFVFFSIAAVSGVLVDAVAFDSWSESTFGWLTLAAAVLTAGSFVRLAAAYRGDGSKTAAEPKLLLRLGWLLCLAALLAALAGLWHARSRQAFRSAAIVNWLERADGAQPVVVRGTLRKTVSLRSNPLAQFSGGRAVSPWQSQLEVSLRQIRVGTEFGPTSGNVLVFVDGDQSHLRPGDALEIYGWLEPFPPPTGPGQVDWRRIYRRRGLHGRIETKNATAITVLDKAPPGPASLVAAIATGGREALFRHTDDQTGPLAVALVIGQRQFVEPQTRDALLATGTAHLLSVSGMHLAILVLVVTWLLSAVGLRPLTQLGIVIAVSLLYVAVTGGRPPVVRAAILISVLLLATCFRRTSQPLNTLGVAALILLAINPDNVFAVGVHLSFLAVITLMLAGRPIAPGSMQAELERERAMGFQSLVDEASDGWLRNVKVVLRFFGQMAWLSACVTAISLPLVWYQFHVVSLVSVVTNVMVWGGLMIALPTGVMAVIVDPIHPLLGVLPGGTCHLALRYMWAVIEWTESWPCSHFWLPAPPGWTVLVFYIVLLATLAVRSRRGTWLRAGWVAVWTVLALVLATRAGPLDDGVLEATFVDVGHGTSVIVRTPDDRVWLYDCGRLGNARGTSRDIDAALWSLGVTHLDAVFLSHGDADHYNALPALLKRFSIDVIVTPPGLLASEERGPRELRRAITLAGVPVREAAAGETIPPIAAAGISVLHPPRGGVGGSDNANSLVLRFHHGEAVLLLPGDLEAPGTERVTSMPRPPAGGVLMAPHHGSLSEDAETILNWARPAETIVSGGERAARMEVEQMLSRTGSGVHITARSGTIRVRIDRAGGVRIRRWLERPW